LTLFFNKSLILNRIELLLDLKVVNTNLKNLEIVLITLRKIKRKREFTKGHHLRLATIVMKMSESKKGTETDSIQVLFGNVVKVL